MKAIYKRELGTYFHSMTGSVCTAFLLAAVGLYFMVYNLYQGAPSFANALVSALYLFIVVIPLLTMRSMAEDGETRPTSCCSPLGVGHRRSAGEILRHGHSVCRTLGALLPVSADYEAGQRQ